MKGGAALLAVGCLAAAVSPAACPGPWGAIATIAGTGTAGFSGDGGAGTAAKLGTPYSVALDPAGDLYIAEYGNHRVRRVDAVSGLISTVAGTGTTGYNGDNISATTAQLSAPTAVAVDLLGNVYIADNANHRVRRLDAGSGLISTVAGTGAGGYNGDNISATAAQLSSPSGVAVNGVGDVFIADYGNQRIRRVDAATGQISTVAGTGVAGFNGDGIAATAARLYSPAGVSVDGAGDLYIADQSNYRIRRVAAGSGLISTVAGNGLNGYSGDGIAATSARLNLPATVIADSGGNLFIADRFNHRVRQVTAATGLISTVAGTGAGGYNGDGIPPGGATLQYPTGVALDSACRLVIADQANHRIRRVDVASLVSSCAWSQAPASVGQWVDLVVTVTNTGALAVTGVMPFSQFNAGGSLLVAKAGPVPAGPVTVSAGAAASFTWTYSVSGAGRVELTDTVSGFDAGLGSTTYAVATLGVTVYAAAQLEAGLAIEPAVALVGQAVDVVLTVTNAGGVNATLVVPSLLVGTGAGLVSLVSGPAPAGPVTLTPGQGQAFRWTWSSSGMGVVDFTATGTGTDSGTGFGIASPGNTAVLVVSPLRAALATAPSPAQPGQLVQVVLTVTNAGATTVSGVLPGLQFDAGGALATLVGGPTPPGPVLLSAGASQGFTWTLSMTAGGVLALTGTGAGVETATGTTVFAASSVLLGVAAMPTCAGPWDLIDSAAGTGTPAYNGDGIAATGAALNGPSAVVLDAAGNVYIADSSNHRVRKVTAATGVISTVVGTGAAGSGGDGGAATAAQVNYPAALALSASGDLYLAESLGNRVRKVDAATGNISTVAGTGVAGFSGDGGSATSAKLSGPAGVAVDAVGNLYVSDSGNHRIRVVAAGTGLISTGVGTGTAGYNGDGMAGPSTRLDQPLGLSLDALGNLYIADRNNHRIRRRAAGTGLISTVAGTGVGSYNGDGIAATAAYLLVPAGVTADAAGDLLIADTGNNRLRRVDAGTGLIATVAGAGGAGTYAGDGGAATAARLNSPWGAALASGCGLWIADRNNYRVRRVDLVATPCAPAAVSIVTGQLPASGSSLQSGTPVTYRMVVTNTGADPITSLALTDTLAPELTAVAADQPAAFGPPVVTPVAPGGSLYVWSASGLSLAPGAAYTFTLTGVAVAPCGAAAIPNAPLVSVTTVCSAASAAAASVACSVPPPVFALEAVAMMLPAAPVAGQSVTYRVVVTNTGAATIATLSVTETLPASVFGATASQPSAFPPALVTSVPAGGTRFDWSAAGLAMPPGASFTFTITGTASVAGPLGASAFVAGLSECLAAVAATAWTGGTAGLPATTLPEIMHPRFDAPLVVYPNPVRAGERPVIALHLEGDATVVEISLYDLGLRRIVQTFARNVRQSEGRVELGSLAGIPPGLYLLRTEATLVSGQRQSFPVAKVVLKP